MRVGAPESIPGKFRQLVSMLEMISGRNTPGLRFTGLNARTLRSTSPP